MAHVDPSVERHLRLQGYRSHDRVSKGDVKKAEMKLRTESLDYMTVPEFAPTGDGLVWYVIFVKDTLNQQNRGF